MLFNFIKIAFRNLWRHKMYSCINIFGLAIAISSCLFIYLYVSHELSYDKYHKDWERIFRVVEEDIFGTEITKFAQTPYPLAEALRTNFPEIADAGQFTIIPAMLIKTEKMGMYHTENNITVADPSILNVFSIPFVKGNSKNALKNEWTTVMSESMAKKYFGNDNPVGKTLKVNYINDKIIGIVKDSQSNTHWKYNIICSFINSVDPSITTDWNIRKAYTYLKLRPGVKVKEFEKKLNEILKNYIPTSNVKCVRRFCLQPVGTIHLNPNLRDEIEPPGSIDQIIIFSSVGALILIITCLNFINLSVARSTTRAREVGIRKAAGSSQTMLILQFLCESLITLLLSSFVAIAISETIFTSFKNLAGPELNIDALYKTNSLIFIFELLTVITVGSCFYPAFLTSKFEPVSVLKSSIRIRSSKSIFRKILVLLQFAISIALLIVFMHMYKQLDFVKNHSFGIDKNQKLISKFPVLNRLGKNYEDVKKYFLKNPYLLSVTFSSNLLGDDNFEKYEQDISFPNKKIRTHIINYFFTDPDFIPTYKINIIAGRNFNKLSAETEINNCLINREAAKMLFQIDPNKTVGMGFKSNYDDKKNMIKIIGVTENFNYQGLQHPIQPLIIMWDSNYFNFATYTVKRKNLDEITYSLDKSWHNAFPTFPFEWTHLDEHFNKQYKSEDLTVLLFNIFSVIGQLLACLGLLGLTTFLTQTRTKEIGIRKALGESTLGITFRISREFLKWVALSNLLAWPAAYIAVNYWLKNFAYHIDISFWPFIISGCLVFLIATITVSFQTVKAASVNPVKSLRYE